MIIVSGTITLQAEGHDAAVELFGPLTEATLAEAGNLTYGFWASPTEPGVFRVYEEWESPEAIGTHMASDHMAAFLTAMAALPITGTDIVQHEVSSSTKLM